MEQNQEYVPLGPFFNFSGYADISRHLSFITHPQAFRSCLITYQQRLGVPADPIITQQILLSQKWNDTQPDPEAECALIPLVFDSQVCGIMIILK